MKKRITLAATLVLTVICASLAISVIFAGSSVISPADTDSCYAKEAIEYVCEKGYIECFYEKDGTAVFSPDAAVSREEFAKILACFLDLRTERTSDKNLSLCDSDKISEKYFPYVRAVCEKGLMGLQKSDDGLYFLPSENVTREEAGYILGNLEGAAVSTYKTSAFSDYSETEKGYMENVSTLIALNMMIGYSDGTFRPKSNITRQELALVLYRMDSSGRTLIY